jgi:thiol-disulfide isomerase/thioredoxin
LGATSASLRRFYHNNNIFQVNEFVKNHPRLKNLSKNMKLKFVFVLISLFSFFYANAQDLKKDQKNVTTLPDIDVYDLNGAHTTLHKLAKNKVLFIDCWFIPCPPCFMAMGVLHNIYAEFKSNKDVCFITICMTDSSQVKAFIRQDPIMKAYVSQYQYFSNLKDFKLPVYFLPGCSSKVPLGTKVLSHYAPDDKSKCPEAIFDFQGYPTSMIFDKNGKQVFKETGFTSVEKYEQEVNAALHNALVETH